MCEKCNVYLFEFWFKFYKNGINDLRKKTGAITKESINLLQEIKKKNNCKRFEAHLNELSKLILLKRGINMKETIENVFRYFRKKKKKARDFSKANQKNSVI